MKDLIVLKFGGSCLKSKESFRQIAKIVKDYLNKSNDYEKHLNKIRECYTKRRDQMIEAIHSYFPQDVHFYIPEGGMFIWCELPEWMLAEKLVHICMDAGVVFVPGNVFYLKGKGMNTLRLNYSKSTPDEINQGIKIIGKAIAFLNSKNKVYQ